MSLTRLDELRSSYHGVERRGRTRGGRLFKRGSDSGGGGDADQPPPSPFWRKKEFAFEFPEANSMTSSRDSSLERRGNNTFRFTDIVDRVSPRLMHVMRSGSFSDADAKRKRWIGRSESLRSGDKNWFSTSTPSENNNNNSSSSNEHSLRRKKRLLQHSQSLREPQPGSGNEDPGKVKGFVNR